MSHNETQLNQDVAFLFNYVFNNMKLTVISGCTCLAPTSYRGDVGTSLCDVCRKKRAEDRAMYSIIEERPGRLKPAAVLAAKLLRNESSRFYITFIDYARKKCTGFAEQVQISYCKGENIDVSKYQW